MEFESHSQSIFASPSTSTHPFPSSSFDSAKTPRSLPPPKLAQDGLHFDHRHHHSSDSMLFVSAEYDVDGLDDSDEPFSRTLEAKATLAPGPSPSPRAASPSPLSWSESWNTGHFTFSPFGAAGDEEHHHESATSKATHSLASEHKSGSSQAETSTASTSVAPSSPIARSKLAPTASAFVPKLASLTPAFPPVTSSLDTGARPFPFHPRSGRSTGASSSPSSSPVEPLTPPAFTHSGAVESHLDHQGHLVSYGSKYTIADEILQLQAQPLGSLNHEELETLSAYDHAPPLARLRTVSEGSNYGRAVEQWRLQQQAPSTFPLRQGPFVPGSPSAGFERSRSSSIASTASSYFSPRPNLERSNTAAELQSYFGPSNVEVNAPLPGGYNSFDPSYPPIHHLTRSSSYASLHQHLAPYPPLAHPEPFNLTAEDPLYLQARDIFVESSCSSLSAPSSGHHQAMSIHFDRAMQTLNPLATLYGLSQDAANQLLAEPEKSGVNDVVLKVAAMRGRQEQMASVQRSAMGTLLPGPSPNNRKLNLYKTELCRSWEEKGSCRYGVKCQFAHGIHELREVARHPKFKSEVCRTFWNQGSCPYGKRCCFIHATGEAAFANGAVLSSASPSKMSMSGPGSRSDSPINDMPVSRLQQRMTSTAVTTAPSRTFGPALSELISSSSSSSNASSLQNSPRQSMRPELATIPASQAPFSETSALFGLGISQRPGQAPPTFREEPKSRLHRFSSMSGLSTPSTITSPALPPLSFHSHSRTDSANSFATTSSVSSGGPTYSPVLARSGSSSSLSSAGSPILLRPLGGEWLSSFNNSTTTSAKDSALDWPQEMEHLSLDDVPDEL